MPYPALADLGRLLRNTDPTTDRDLLDRYLTLHDQEAFGALVKRHHQTVLSACRQVLPCGTNVDDVFQATFLVLLSRTDSARWQPSLGGWLYAVAHRVAVRTRRTEQRRIRRETRLALRETVASNSPDLFLHEAIEVLHEELDRLPDQYRLPLLLCYLEGLSRDEAATQLGWTLGTLRGRLARGRQVLRQKLTRRGIALSAGLLAGVAETGAANVAPAPNLIATTVQAARGSGSPTARQLAKMIVPPRVGLRLGSTLIAMAVLGLCLGLYAGEKSQKEPMIPLPLMEANEKKAETPAVERDNEFHYAGIVLDPAGKPLAGANVHISGLIAGYIEFKPRVKTGVDGRFEFVVKREEFQTRPG